MAINRAQLAKELEPGLNALFGMEYARYENQHAEIFTTESSDRAFEEEVMLSGFGSAPTKSEGSGIAYDDAQEAYTARYNHETVALAFSITEEAIEDNLSRPVSVTASVSRIRAPCSVRPAHKRKAKTNGERVTQVALSFCSRLMYCLGMGTTSAS
jgi:hypothetical protein